VDVIDGQDDEHDPPEFQTLRAHYQRGKLRIPQTPHETEGLRSALIELANACDDRALHGPKETRAFERAARDGLSKAVAALRQPRHADREIEHSDLRVVVSTDRMRDGDDIPGVGFMQGGALVTYHVTDNPDVVRAIVGRRGRLMAAYGAAGKYSELGPGLYVSGNPTYWLNRSRGKWAFLKRLTAPQLERLLNALSSQLLEMRAKRWLSEGEYERGARDLQYTRAGHYDATVLTMFAGQPYNIKFWEPGYLHALGIQPGPAPRVVEIRLRGSFAEVQGNRPSASLLRMLRRTGVAGIFTRAGMSTSPELVIWDPHAVVGAREVDL